MYIFRYSLVNVIFVFSGKWNFLITSLKINENLKYLISQIYYLLKTEFKKLASCSVSLK